MPVFNSFGALAIAVAPGDTITLFAAADVLVAVGLYRRSLLLNLASRPGESLPGRATLRVHRRQ